MKSRLDKDKNLELLDKRISELNLKGEIVIAFDFDELLVPIHLTAEVSKKLSKPANKEKLKCLKKGSFERIYYLNSLMNGQLALDYKRLAKKISKETEWSRGFRGLIEFLIKKYSVIVISSGLKDVCEAKLSEVNFDNRNIIAGELNFENLRISGSSLVISDELKGYIVEKIKKKYKVISIGHSLGDEFMLNKSDMGISVNSEIPQFARFEVSSPEEVSKIIYNSTKD